jgi:ribosomal protein S18 acetylase RimI-like enzyme
VINIEIRQLKETEIYSYLLENDQIFAPPLSTRLELKNYALKLKKFAIHFCAFQNETLVGLLACYFNDPTTKIAFISTVSIIKEFQGKGLANRLLTTIKKYSINNGFNQIRLKVHISNRPAIKVYSANGFLEVSRKMDWIEMALNL